MITEQDIQLAINGAMASRGKNKGKLKATCPKMNTPEASAWQAIQCHANPYKVGFGHMMFMSPENREIFNIIDKRLEGIYVGHLDKDREALEAMGVW